MEAVQLYLRRLTPRGVLSISRWTRIATGLEAPRLVLLVKRALELEGVAEPERHILVAEGDAIATVVVSREPFELADLQRLDEVCEQRGFLRHWPIGPATPPRSPIAEVLAAGPGTFAGMGLDLSPSTDDRPFFFHLVPVFGRVDPKVREFFSPQESAVVLLRLLMVVVGIVTLALILLPIVASRVFPSGGRAWRGSFYFAAIGAAFLLVEAVLIQKFILYLGHPSHATTVVLTAVLAGAGLGSFAAGRVPGGSIDLGKFALPLVVSTLPFLLPALFSATLGWPLSGRVAVSVAVVLPVATLMGFAFPLGMNRFGEGEKAWFWAINGVTGVFAGVASLALAMTIGYTGVLGLGTAAYLLAAFLLPPRA